MLPKIHWSNDERDILVAELAKGASFSEVSDALRAKGFLRSRNACIGYAERGSLKSTHKPYEVDARQMALRIQDRKRAAAERSANARRAKAAAAAEAAGRDAAQAIVNEQEGRGLARAEVRSPDAPTEVIRLTDLGRRMCKWPFGDPGDEDFHFCGARTEGSFCDVHKEVGLKPVRDDSAKAAAWVRASDARGAYRMLSL